MYEFLFFDVWLTISLEITTQVEDFILISVSTALVKEEF